MPARAITRWEGRLTTEAHALLDAASGFVRACTEPVARNDPRTCTSGTTPPVPVRLTDSRSDAAHRCVHQLMRNGQSMGSQGSASAVGPSQPALGSAAVRGLQSDAAASPLDRVRAALDRHAIGVRAAQGADSNSENGQRAASTRHKRWPSAVGHLVRGLDNAQLASSRSESLTGQCWAELDRATEEMAHTLGVTLPLGRPSLFRRTTSSSVSHLAGSASRRLPSDAALDTGVLILTLID
jgi:hypothetical protein